MYHKRPWLNPTLLLGSVLLSLAGAEGALRALGFEAWTRIDRYDPAPVMADVDAELGWVNRPGRYRYSTTADGTNPVTITISPDGTRLTPVPPSPQAKEIWFMGDSFTVGWAVTDGEDYPSLIARRNPNRRVRNFGVPGYSTLQALLTFRRASACCLARPPELVVYGFIPFHNARNVAAEKWLSVRARVARETGDLARFKTPPHARLDAHGALHMFPPTDYSKWPLSDHSALSNLLQDQVISIRSNLLAREMDPLTVALVSRFRDEVEHLGGRFILFFLFVDDENAGKKQFYLDAFRNAAIEVIDGTAVQLTEKSQVPGDGHPNLVIHRQWADLFLQHMAR